jgi:hypothetical protein
VERPLGKRSLENQEGDGRKIVRRISGRQVVRMGDG